MATQPGTLTTKHHVNLVKSAITAIEKQNNDYYIFVAKPTPWLDANGNNIDSNPPLAQDTVTDYEQSIYHEMIYGKYISNNSLAFMIPNYSWTANTVYAPYDYNDPLLYSKQFYVVNSLGAVYKCIDNNSGANSTVQPNLTSPYGTFRTSDGYHWKYMYTIDSTSNNTFTTPSYVPVIPDANVVSNSVSGSIDFIKLLNKGSGYETYREGFLVSVVDSQTLQIESTASPLDDYYTGSCIYLKTGSGGGQLRNIKKYYGLSNRVIVDAVLTTFETLLLSNTNGTFNIGQTVVQNFTDVSFLNSAGFFNPGDTVVQPNTNATGTVVTVNSSMLSISPSGVNSFDILHPIYSTVQAPLAKTGTVNIVAGNTWVTANTGTAFTTDFSVGDFIDVGTGNTNIRRVTAVNSTVIVTSYQFDNTLSGVGVYKVPNAIDPVSSTLINANGVITQTNINGASLVYSNASSTLISYIIGETINAYNSNGIYQNANATVSFANSSTLILSNINGVFSPGQTVVGQSSLLSAQVNQIISYPNITVSNVSRPFTTGQQISALDASNNVIGYATLILMSQSPNQLTEYIISPRINITGDGNGALAYCTCNTVTTGLREVTDVIMVNQGSGYTQANVTITANTSYGTGAAARASVSPVSGHGSDPLNELGAFYLGISVTFDTQSNELNKFPGYGQYRRWGLLKNPTFNDAVLNLTNFTKATLNIANRAANTFQVGEMVLQPSSNAYGVYTSGNSTTLVLNQVHGLFAANTAGDNIVGLTTQTTANCKSWAPNYFRLQANVETISTAITQSTATITQIFSNTQIRIGNISGVISPTDGIIDPLTNATANIASIFVANGTVDATTSFGARFNQTARVTLTSNSNIPFQFGEQVIQSITNTTARVLSTNTDYDFTYTVTGGTFSAGQTLTDITTGANGVVIFANTSYLKITSSAGSWNQNDVINTITGNGTISAVSTVLVLYDVNGVFQSGLDTITGVTSGAIGVSALSGLNYYPDLVRNTGEVMYINNIVPFQKSKTSKEQFRLVVKL